MSGHEIDQRIEAIEERQHALEDATEESFATLEWDLLERAIYSEVVAQTVRMTQELVAFSRSRGDIPGQVLEWPDRKAERAWILSLYRECYKGRDGATEADTEG